MEISVNQEWTVGDLIEFEKEGALRVNHEYQRGLRWTTSQNQMFIDSVFRGYSIPAFYFHKTTATKSGNVFYDIVDGQQRINAIRSYSEGAFPLLCPNDDAGFKFPNFMKNASCPWGGNRFPDLLDELKNQLKQHKIVVYEITTENENTIRDLFIRLQGGTPLTPQDKRDSWPGNFTEFVLRIGGKDGVDKWYGLPLFKEVSKVTNETKRRQLAAQIFMLYWTAHKENRFCDIKSSNIDVFYHTHIDFDENAKEARNFEKTCGKLYEIFQGKPKLLGHYLIHLFLLCGHFLEEYAQGWEHQLADKWQEFESRRQRAANNVKNNKEEDINRYYYRYGRLTQTQSDNASTIRERHAFFVEEMLNLLSPKKLDPMRTFSDLERQTVFFRDKELCQWSLMRGNNRKVPWDEGEIHHVIPHAQGGETKIYNAALVHRDYHPKSAADVLEFREWWSQKYNNKAQTSIKKPNRSARPPDGTKLRFSFKGKIHHGEYTNGKIVLNANGKKKHCSSLTEASMGITGTSRNGWRDWHFCLPGKDQWILADNWRNGLSE